MFVSVSHFWGVGTEMNTMVMSLSLGCPAEAAPLFIFGGCIFYLALTWWPVTIGQKIIT